MYSINMLLYLKKITMVISCICGPRILCTWSGIFFSFLLVEVIIIIYPKNPIGNLMNFLLGSLEEIKLSRITLTPCKYTTNQ